MTAGITSGERRRRSVLEQEKRELRRARKVLKARCAELKSPRSLIAWRSVLTARPPRHAIRHGRSRERDGVLLDGDPRGLSFGGAEKLLDLRVVPCDRVVSATSAIRRASCSSGLRCRCVPSAHGFGVARRGTQCQPASERPSRGASSPRRTREGCRGCRWAG